MAALSPPAPHAAFAGTGPSARVSCSSTLQPAVSFSHHHLQVPTQPHLASLPWGAPSLLLHAASPVPRRCSGALVLGGEPPPTAHSHPPKSSLIQEVEALLSCSGRTLGDWFQATVVSWRHHSQLPFQHGKQPCCLFALPKPPGRSLPCCPHLLLFGSNMPNPSAPQLCSELIMAPLSCTGSGVPPLPHLGSSFPLSET